LTNVKLSCTNDVLLITIKFFHQYSICRKEDSKLVSGPPKTHKLVAVGVSVHKRCKNDYSEKFKNSGIRGRKHEPILGHSFQCKYMLGRSKSRNRMKRAVKKVNSINFT